MSNRTEKVAGDHGELLDLANVVGVMGGDDKVVVLVTEKKPPEELNSFDVVPRSLEGESTDVIEVGTVEAKAQPGDSIGLSEYGTGTLGGVVYDEHGVAYGLTNVHVLGSNRALPLSLVHSPGPYDALGPSIGRLDRYTPIYFDRPNRLDAALFRLHVVEEPTHTARVFTPRVGWSVSKTGWRSGYSEGEVIGRNATVDVNFGAQGTARFVNQIVTSYMLDSGDSGSVLSTTGGYPCGLGFAGSDTVSLHTPIALVLRTLGVSFDW